MTTISARCRHPGCTARPRNRRGPVKRFLANVQRAAVGGLEFVRARVEMKAVETIVHLRREMPAKIKNRVPPHVWPLVQPYGLVPADNERAHEPAGDRT